MAETCPPRWRRWLCLAGGGLRALLVAAPSLGKALAHPSRRPQPLALLPAALFTEAPHDMTAQAGEDVEMACSFRGTGSPSYSLEIQWWYVRTHRDWTDKQTWASDQVTPPWPRPRRRPLPAPTPACAAAAGLGSQGGPHPAAASSVLPSPAHSCPYPPCAAGVGTAVPSVTAPDVGSRRGVSCLAQWGAQMPWPWCCWRLLKGARLLPISPIRLQLTGRGLGLVGTAVGGTLLGAHSILSSPSSSSLRGWARGWWPPASSQPFDSSSLFPDPATTLLCPAAESGSAGGAWQGRHQNQREFG